MVISGSIYDFENVVDTKKIKIYRQDTHIYLRKGMIDYKFNVKDLLDKKIIKISNSDDKYTTYEVCNYE